MLSFFVSSFVFIDFPQIPMWITEDHANDGNKLKENKREKAPEKAAV